jgi:hypothetical protein
MQRMDSNTINNHPDERTSTRSCTLFSPTLPLSQISLSAASPVSLPDAHKNASADIDDDATASVCSKHAGKEKGARTRPEKKTPSTNKNNQKIANKELSPDEDRACMLI